MLLSFAFEEHIQQLSRKEEGSFILYYEIEKYSVPYPVM